MTVLLTVLLKIYPEEPSIHAGYSRFINGTYPTIFWFQTVSSAALCLAITAIGLLLFLSPALTQPLEKTMKRCIPCFLPPH
jgi:hypothetical protein